MCFNPLEFLEQQQMRGDEAWKAVYGEVSSLGTRMEQWGRSSAQRETEVVIGPEIPFEGRKRTHAKTSDAHWETSDPEFRPNIPLGRAAPRFFNKPDRW